MKANRSAARLSKCKSIFQTISKSKSSLDRFHHLTKLIFTNALTIAVSGTIKEIMLDTTKKVWSSKFCTNVSHTDVIRQNRVIRPKQQVYLHILSIIRIDLFI